MVVVLNANRPALVFSVECGSCEMVSGRRPMDGGRREEGGGRVIEQVWEGQLTCWDYKLSGMAPVPRADSFQVGPSDCPCKA